MIVYVLELLAISEKKISGYSPPNILYWIQVKWASGMTLSKNLISLQECQSVASIVDCSIILFKMSLITPQTGTFCP